VVGQAWLLSGAIDAAFLGGAPLERVGPRLTALAAVAFVRAGLLWLQEITAQRLSGRVRVEVRDRLTRQLLARGPHFVAKERAGELVSTLVGGYLSQYLPQASLAALVPALVVAAVLRADPLSGAVLLLTFPLVPLFMWLIGQESRKVTRRQWITLSRLAARLQDSLAGLPTLRVLGRTEEELRTLEGLNHRYRTVTMRALRLAFLSALVLEALATLGTAVVAVEVGLRLLHARIGFRAALFVLMLAPEFYRPLRALGAAFHAGMAGREAARRLRELADAEGHLAAPAILTGGSTLPATRPRGVRPPGIRFDEVTFSYGRAAAPALDGLTLDVPAGRTLALLGPTGSGKTTATHLLLRWLEPDGGRILVDGIPLASRTPEEWRQDIAWVPQHPHLFHATLRENLLIASPSATRADLDRAIEQASLAETVSALPGGLDTPLGEGGERLSGGEAQRVALARAFLRDAPLVVLDEPTAHLDLETEAVLLGAVRRLCRGRTVLLVAHRLTTVETADAVAIVSGGRVVEAGTPTLLASSGAIYRRLLAASRGMP